MDIFEQRTAAPMLIAGESEPFDSPEYQYELKMDGERCLAYLDKTGVELVNRRGRRVLPQFPELANLHRQSKKRCIVDGEMIVGVGGKSEFELIKQRALVKRPYAIQRLSAENPCTFVALDILYLDHAQTTHLPLLERQAILRKNIVDGERMAMVRPVEQRGIDFFRVVREKGLEGIIAKRKDSVYLMGKRTRDWIKIKNWVDADFVVCGYLPSESASVASLILGQYNDAGELVYKGRVTLGVSRPEFKEIQKQPRAEAHPFPAEPPAECKGALWLRPSLVCKAGFICWTANKRLRQPFYKHMVPEKNPREVVEPLEMASC